jgi:isopentenyl phosphate kinase
MNKEKPINKNKISITQKPKTNSIHEVGITHQEHCDIVYDTKSTVVVSADGVLFQMDKSDKEAKLLFYYRVPSLNNINKNHNKKQLMRCTVEIRMNIKKIAVVAASILEKISTHEEIQADIKLLEQGKTDQIMFG